MKQWEFIPLEEDFNKGEIVIYKSKEGPKLEVQLKEETLWLTQEQIALLFGTQRPAITKHLKNIFESGELDEKVACSVLEHTTQHGAIKGKTQTKKVKYYNLDAIISVGYRVNSQRATQFRIWATNTLKEHLIKGYTVNEKRLLQAQSNLKELQETISFLQDKSQSELFAGQEQEILNLLTNYSKTLSLLEQYDKEKLSLIKNAKDSFVLKYEDAFNVIIKLKKELIAKKEASDLFGKETSNRFKAILGSIYQTFNKKELYPSLEEKAAHLLYFIIKDHPFVDGNKRIASFLFVYFLDKNNFLYRKTGEKKINDNTLTTLALLIAISNPNDKEKIIKIITNLIAL